MTADRLWTDLLEEYRALGGAADNVRLDDGPLGRGLFLIESGKPFLLRTPPNLLVKVSDILVENGVLKVAAAADVGEPERKFLEAYYAQFSWGGGGRAEVERIFEQAQALPAQLRHKLVVEGYGEWFKEPTEQLVQQQFIRSREFGNYHGEGPVLMPMIDLANHGVGCSYDSADGIALKGSGEDEITVHYAEADPLGFFHRWGFAAESSIAFSAELTGFIGGERLYITRRRAGATTSGKPDLPGLTRTDNGWRMDFLMLGNRNLPRLCRGIFRRLFRQAGFEDVDETFDKIRMANQQRFLGLLADLEPLEGPMVHNLRRLARLQLHALTYCFGARDV